HKPARAAVRHVDELAITGAAPEHDPQHQMTVVTPSESSGPPALAAQTATACPTSLGHPERPALDHDGAPSHLIFGVVVAGRPAGTPFASPAGSLIGQGQPAEVAVLDPPAWRATGVLGSGGRLG